MRWGLLIANRAARQLRRLSDPEKKVAEAYGVLMPVGVANRWTFYIGPDGKILDIDRQVKASTSGDDMVAKLTALGVKKKS